jgi:hypothetical protein
MQRYPHNRHLEVGPERPLLFTVIPAVIILAFSVLAGFMVHYSTPRGPWAFSDSTEYLEAGRNFAAGRGFVVQRMNDRYAPLSLRPPLYSFILGAMIKSGIDPVVGSGWLNRALYAGLILIVGLAVYKYTSNPGLILVLLLFLYLENELVDAFASMMTEPLFITLTVAQILLLVIYLRSNRLAALAASVFLAGVLWMTRYAGAANTALLGVGIILFSKHPFRQRLILSILSILTSAIPYIAWSIHLRSSGYSAGVYDWHMPDLWQSLVVVRAAFIDSLWKWLPFGALPLNLTYLHRFLLLTLFFLITLIAIVYAIYYSRRPGRASLLNKEAFQWASLLVIFAILHLVVIAVSYVLVSVPKPALIGRVLLPSKITLLFGLGILFYELGLHLFRPKLAILLPAAFLLPLVFIRLPQVEQNISNLHTTGKGYTAVSWQDLRIIAELKGLPASIPIVSNDPNAVMFFAARPAYPLPELKDDQPVESNAHFGLRTQDEAEATFRQNGAALVLFSNANIQLMRIYGEDWQATFRSLTDGLFIYYDGLDGSIFFYVEPGPWNQF